MRQRSLHKKWRWGQSLPCASCIEIAMFPVFVFQVVKGQKLSRSAGVALKVIAFV